MKVTDVKAWMKANRITQEALAERLGYAHRVTVATNLKKDRETVSPEFLGRLIVAYPETRSLLLDPATETGAAQPECA